MAEESSISGLNIIHPEMDEPNTMRDLDAHLEMWTHLAFPQPAASEESQREPVFSAERDTASRSRHKATNPPDPFVNLSDPLASSLSFFGNVGASYIEQAQRAASGENGANDFLPNWQMGDLFLGGAPVDPFLVPPSLPPLTIREPSHQKPTAPIVHTIDPSAASFVHQAASKKSRRLTIDTTNDINLTQSPIEPETPQSANGPPLSAAEDKRRRNTLASARFRLKKKEREVAMEKKAKDLDERVSQLERECETLRKENGWLKGLVVGATTGEGVPVGNGAVVDIDELIKALRANGTLVTGSSASAIPETSAPAAPPATTATGKRKRGAAASSA